MEENEDYGLEEIQATLLKALMIFNDLCRENGIYYSLHGGTLLGAERNHRFIPWDDDVDISMTRAEFRKFRELVASLPANTTLDEHTMWFPRFVMRQEENVVYVDILIWDYISSNKIAQKMKINLLRFFQGMMKTHVEYNRFGLINKMLLFITHNIGKLIPQKVKIKQFNYLCEKCLTGKKEFIHRSNDAFVGVSYIFDSHYMDDYKDIEFEGQKCMVNVRYHEFLERNYGPDYLTPPPKEKRVPEHEKFRKDL